MSIPCACNPRSRHMLPLAFEALFQAQVVILGLQVKVSIIWKGHKKIHKRFFGRFSIHLLILFSIVVECSKWFSLGNSFFLVSRFGIFVKSISTSIHFENMKAS